MPLTDFLMEARAVAIEAAFLAGAHLRAHLYRDKEVRFKGDIDLVTRIDTEAEQIILERIRRTFPKHAFLAEESAGATGADAQARWIIDPLDGTTNFVHSVPHFAVSIALEWQGRLEVGVVYDPCRDELFEATVGEGARLNGRPIRVSGVAELNGALLGTGFPYDRQTRAEVYLAYYDVFLRRCQGIRRFGAAALDLAYVACGRLDGFWEFCLKPWDVAAGIVLVREAGGRAVGREGRPAGIHDPLIVAAAPGLEASMLEIIRGLPDPTQPESL